MTYQTNGWHSGLYSGFLSDPFDPMGLAWTRTLMGQCQESSLSTLKQDRVCVSAGGLLSSLSAIG